MGRIVRLSLAALFAATLYAQTPPAPANELADQLAQRLGRSLGVKTVVGDAVKVGAVTLIPILTVDYTFVGGGAPGSSDPKKPAPPAGGFYVSGEARPVAFVAITKRGTRVITVPGGPQK